MEKEARDICLKLSERYLWVCREPPNFQLFVLCFSHRAHGDMVSSGFCSAGLVTGFHDLTGLFLPQLFYDSICRHCVWKLSLETVIELQSTWEDWKQCPSISPAWRKASLCQSVTSACHHFLNFAATFLSFIWVKIIILKACKWQHQHYASQKHDESFLLVQLSNPLFLQC